MASFDTSIDVPLWEPIAPGRHIAQITKALVEVSRNNNKMIVLEWTVVGPADSDKGQNWREWITWEKKPGLRSLVMICRSANPPIVGSAQDPSGLDPEDQDSVIEHMLGLCLAVEVGHEENTWTNQDGEEKTGVNVRTEKVSALTADEENSLFSEYGEDGPPLSSESLKDFKGRPIRTNFEISGGVLVEAGDLGADIPF